MPWVLSIVSITWHLINFFLAKRQKNNDRDYDEWKRERDSVFLALRSFEDSLDLLSPISKGVHDLDALRRELAAANQSVALTHGKLVREINRAKEMKLPIGAGYGMQIEGESAWDRLIDAFSDAEIENDPAKIRSLIPRIQSCGYEIQRSVEAVCKNRPKA